MRGFYDRLKTYPTTAVNYFFLRDNWTMLLFQLIKMLISDPLQFVIAVILLVFPLLISITVHEWAHGFTAYKFGDPTPKLQGRLSFNPFAHLDPIGTLMLFIVGIGWAKPVEIIPENIQSKNKLMLVGLAGPLSNFVLAIIFIFILYFAVVFFSNNPAWQESELALLAVILLGFIIRINFALGIFNLLPLPPLDGANVISNLLPDNLARTYFRLAPFSMPILLIFLISGGVKVIFDFADNIQNFLLVFIDSLLFNIL